MSFLLAAKKCWSGNVLALNETTHFCFTLKDFLSNDLVKPLVKNFIEINLSPIYKQKLTHQLISVAFLNIVIDEEIQFDEFVWVNKKQVQKLSFPRVIRTFFMDNKYL